MLKIEDVKNKIAGELVDFFGFHEFKFKKTNNEFIKDIDGYRYYIHLPLTTFSNSIFMQVSIYLKHKEVEKIFKKITGDSEEYTIGNEVGIIFNNYNRKIFKSGDLNFFLKNAEDVDLAIEDVKSYFGYIIKPYFEKYSSLNVLECAFNNDPSSYNSPDVGGALDSRCIKGLILASLVGKNIFDGLVDSYDNQISKTPKSSIAIYEKVKDYLKYNKS